MVAWWWWRGGGGVVVVAWWWWRGGGGVVVVAWWWWRGGGGVVVVWWWWRGGGGVVVVVHLKKGTDLARAQNTDIKPSTMHRFPAAVCESQKIMCFIINTPSVEQAHLDNEFQATKKNSFTHMVNILLPSQTLTLQ